MKRAKESTRVYRLMNQVKKLREKKDRLKEALIETDARLADLELEWADLQKDISNTIFGRTGLDEVEARQKKKPLVRKHRSGPGVRKKPDGSRAEIQAAAKRRDAKLISALSRKTPRSIEDLHGKVGEGTLSQMQTSLKRLRKLNRIKRIGSGRSVRYTLKGK